MFLGVCWCPFFFGGGEVFFVFIFVFLDVCWFLVFSDFVVPDVFCVYPQFG